MTPANRSRIVDGLSGRRPGDVAQTARIDTAIVRTSRFLAALTLATTGAVLACSPAPAQDVSASASQASSDGVAPLRMGMLPAGTYSTTRFEPTLILTLGEGWTQLFADDADEVALENKPEGVALNITRVTRVVDPRNGSRVEAPEDLIAWLASHPALSASEPEPVTVAGIEGRTLTIGPSTGDVPLFSYPSGDMRLPPTEQARIYVVPLDGPDLTVFQAGPGGADAVDELVRPILASITVIPED